MSALPASTSFVFRISRSFDAPRSALWNAWTKEEELKQWFGPKGCPVFSSKLELQPGGAYHYGLKTPIGMKIWGKWVFQEIVPEQKLAFTAGFSDPEGNITRNPWNPHWPLINLSTVYFEEKDGKTIFTLEGVAIDASEVECQSFEQGNDSMQQGWNGTLDQLEGFLRR
jgi:uncharacterized protein YndB with AHSA1/START domain